MKRLTFSIIFLIVLTSTTVFSQSQILVNKVWEHSFGQPDEYDWVASTIDNNENVITAGHSTISQTSTKLLLKKLDEQGVALWESNFETNTNTKNYGTAITTDNVGNIYVTGVNNVDGSIGKNDFLLLKYDSNGTVLWNKLIDGTGQGDDIPVDIILDGFGFIYITGVSLGIGSEMDYFTLKINPTTGNTVWQKRYDYNNLYDIPVDISFDSQGNILVTGTSAASIVNWEVAVIKYSPDGTLLDEERIGNAGIGFDKPSGITKDMSGNLFIAGTTTVDGISFDIKTIKLDNDLNLLWSTTYDGGQIDSISAVQIDPLGNVVLTGWQSNEYGGTEILTLQYSSVGNLNWTKKRTVSLPTASGKSKSLAIDNQGNIFIAGEINDGEKSTIKVSQYNSSGEEKWSAKLANPNARFNTPLELFVNQQEEIFLTTIAKEENANQYTTYKLSTLTRNLDAILDSNGDPSHLSDEIIIRFKPDIVSTAFVDDKALRFNTVGSIITASNVVQEIETQLSVTDFKDWTAIKIHPNLTSSDTTATTRFGKTIQVPDFFNTLVLKIPRNSGMTVENVVQRLSDGNLSCYIRFAEINPVLTLDDCDPDDDRYPTQGNLHPTATYPDGHINMEPAWCIAGAGNSDIRVSIIDSGIRWSHEDFGDGTFAGSVIADGKDYETGADISDNNENDVGNHGTKVASVVGSIRNNEIGVAGIAGGSGSADGVRLICQRVFFGGVPASTLIQALEESHGEYSADLVNVSGGYNSLSTADNFAMREAVHHLNRMGIIVSGSRGNDGSSTPRLPGTIQDEWTICVGGTHTNGEYNSECRIGFPIDIAAPSRWQLTRTAENYENGTNIPSDQGYGGISFTSGATPHATGLAAVMVGYSETGLVQEDIEYIIQTSATDVGDPDYDDETGHGRINAGAALQMIETPACQVLHFGTDQTPSSLNNELVEEDVILELTEPFTTEGGQTFDIGTYTADVYKVTATIVHTLPANTSIQHNWERHSSSTVFKLYETSGSQNELQPLENVKFTGYSVQGFTELEGYVYYLKNSTCSIEGWIPASPTEADLAHSVIVCLTTGTESVSTNSLQVYPNPALGQLTISLPENVLQELFTVSVYDFSGKKMASRKVSSQNHMDGFLRLNINNFPQGIYTCIIESEGQVHLAKFTKF